MSLPAHLTFKIPTYNSYDALRNEDTTDTDSLSDEEQNPVSAASSVSEAAEITRKYSMEKIKPIETEMKASGRVIISQADKDRIVSIIKLNGDLIRSVLPRETRYSSQDMRNVRHFRSSFQGDRSMQVEKKWRMENTNWRSREKH